MEGMTETKFGTKVACGEDDAQTSNTHTSHSAHIAEKARDTTLADENITCVTETGDVQ